MAERLIETRCALVSANVFPATERPTGQASGKPLVVGIHGGGFTFRYHDSGAFSLRREANAAGFDVILLDRPGYGRSHFTRRGGAVLEDNVAALAEAIGVLWQEFGAGSSGIYLIGHSIGGAIALLISAGERDWPLAGVSVSGIGDRTPAPVGGGPGNTGGPGGDTTYLMPHRGLFTQLFFAPGAATEEAMSAMEAAAFPVLLEEVGAVHNAWAPIALTTLARIREPVQILLAEHERLWQSDGDAVTRLRAALATSDRSEVGVLPGVGHCTDFHDGHDVFHRRVLAFATPE